MSTRIRTRIAARLARIGGVRARIAAVAGIVTFAVLAGTTSSYAYFQMTQQATATATSGALTVSTTNFASMAYQFRNDQIDAVGSFTVSNASDTTDGFARTAVITLSSAMTDSTQARTSVSYVYWQKGSNETCATGHSKTGAKTWANSSTITLSLAPGDSTTYCVESYAASAASLAVVGGALTLTPTLTATLAAGGWTASTGATASQNSVAIYPASTVPTVSWWFVHPVSAPTACWDDTSFGTASGTPAISYACKTTTTGNQQWQFASGGSGTYEIINRNAQGLRLDPQGTTAGANVNLVTNSTATTQNWTPQLVSGTANQSGAVYQFVNQSSNLCITVGAQQSDGLAHLVQNPCTGQTTQRFVLELAKLEDFTCTTTGAGTNQRPQYAWTNQYGSGDDFPYTFVTTYGNAIRTIATVNTGSSVTVSGTAPTGARLIDQANGTYVVNVLDSDGSVVATDQVVVRSNVFGTKYLTCD